MSIIIFIIGITLPTALGWIILKNIEGHAPVLGKIERMLWAIFIGPILMTYVTFLLQWTGIVQFTLLGFIMPLLTVTLVLVFVAHIRGVLKIPSPNPFIASRMPSGIAKFFLLALVIWSVTKIFAGAYDTISVPTYWDDSLDGWNMRGKIFYETQEITLAIPTLDENSLDIAGESSYPPSVPLIKTWLSLLHGSWNEAVVNSIHIIWYTVLLGSFFFLLRRHLSITWSIVGTYILASQPLPLVQGINPYADILLAGLLLLAVASIAQASITENVRHQKSWLMLSALIIATTIFTKNEAIILYVPIVSLLLSLFVYKQIRYNRLSFSHAIRLFITLGMIISLVGLPWLVFKWSNDLTFGNAKAVSDLSIQFHGDSLKAMWFFLSKEANYLLLPLSLVFVLIIGRKYLLTFPYVIFVAFLVFTFFEQLGIYTFTSLYVEAVKQTGIGRGLSQLVPLATLLLILLGKKILTNMQHD